jgi:CelD/BcsL family acetyltransferase involved in cellulose biosynthesis
VLPPWLEVWWSSFGEGWNPYLLSIKDGQGLLGIAPLMVSGGKAMVMGSPDVCDYLDLILTPGKEKDLFKILLRHLKQEGIGILDLGPLRADDPLLKYATSAAEKVGYETRTELEDVTLEMGLPETWEGYLQGITGKQRHEIRRKLRRLYEGGEIAFRVVESPEEVSGQMENFLTLFRSSRTDKDAFMTQQMASFFRSLAKALAEREMVKLFFLDIDDLPAAAALCFDYADTTYLYNSGYDPRYNALSVGLMCKVLSIKESVEKGRRRYNFLKGQEAYKYRLGGDPVELHMCQVIMR